MNNRLHHKFTSSNGSSVVLAKISLVTKDLSLVDLQPYEKGHSSQRALQLAAADILASDLLGRTVGIERNEFGRPVLPDCTDVISISHTDDYIAIIHHPSHRVAIDIELIGRDIQKIESRFTDSRELSLFKEFEHKQKLLFIWSIKECLFKIARAKGVLFKEHLIIAEAQDEREVLTTHCHVDHEDHKSGYTANSVIFEPLILTYID